MSSNDFPTIHEFEILAIELIENIPTKFLEGLGGIFVQPIEKMRDDIAHVYILGEYIRRSHFEPNICLYYGSFKKVHYGKDHRAIKQAMWELITHELQHHLERHFEIQDLAKADQEQLEQIMIDQGKLRPLEYLRSHQLINHKKVGMNLIADVLVTEKQLKNGTKIRLTGAAIDWREVIVNIPQNSSPGKVLRLANMGYRDKSGAGDFYLFLQDNNKKPGKLKINREQSLFIFGNNWNEEFKHLYKKKFKRNNLTEEDVIFPALNEKKINLDYYYDALIFLNEVSSETHIFVIGLGKEKHKIKLKLKPNEEHSSYTLKFPGLGEKTATKNGDVYLTLYPAR
ncbi:MAG: hypothetical protein MUC94_11515 [bacterium]|nr:hypothetical protein [bacterium]